MRSTWIWFSICLALYSSSRYYSFSSLLSFKRHFLWSNDCGCSGSVWFPAAAVFYTSDFIKGHCGDKSLGRGCEGSPQSTVKNREEERMWRKERVRQRDRERQREGE